jgi:two-component system, cell cycle response regulator DivK
MKILYVEENKNNVHVLQQRLTRLGHTVLIATDGERALAMTAATQPDLVVMDLSLPGLDGWEATRRLKSMPATRDIPVLALSAHAIAGDREKALAAGGNDYEPKPIDFARLRGTIDALLGNGRGADPGGPRPAAP